MESRRIVGLWPQWWTHRPYYFDYPGAWVIPDHILSPADCLQVMKRMPSHSVDSLITDPPSGINFMGKHWDSDKGGRDHWIAWLRDVMKEALRVMKPGAHGLVWALPRTSHWTATALEDAGFEVRDVVNHLFGSGFPKSHDISKAIDKDAGAEREVLKKHIQSASNPNIHAGGSTYGMDGPTKDRLKNTWNITTPSTEAAKQWQGWGSALKPACEHWVLVRKPLEKGLTLAENTLKWGCGGINIDRSRVGTDAMTSGGSIPDIRANNYENSSGKPRLQTDTVMKQGRFPSNLIFSHNPDCVEAGTKKVNHDGTETVAAWECSEGCAVSLLDEQSGTRRSSGIYDNKSEPHSNMYGMNANKANIQYSDSGGASRFFKCFARGTNTSWQGLNDSQNASTVEVHSDNIKKQIVSVLEAVLKKEDLEGKQLKDSTLLFIQETLKQLNSNEEIDLPMIQNIASRYWQELKLIEKFHKDHASYVEMMKLTDIMKIIPNLSMLNSTVESATSNTMQMNSDHGVKDLKGNRFIYCAKPSKREKNLGCEGLPEVVSGVGDERPSGQSMSRLDGRPPRKMQNIHPTVKSTKLMSYLINMITPPQGVVMDPFMGSGTTGVSALSLGYQFIGMEKEHDYFIISLARIRYLSEQENPIP